MPDYQKMYTTLFNSQTRAIEILQKAQQETEELYISSPESELAASGVAKKDSDSGKQDKSGEQQ